MSEAAPGKLDLVRRFLNTVSFERGEDAFTGPDALPDWCAAEGFDCGASPSGIKELRRFREALRAVAFANAGHGDRSESWQALQPFVSRSTFTIEVADDVLSLDACGEAEYRVIGTLLAIVYDAIRTGEWARFKACRADDCRWAFYDESKNGSGTWCSMASCGNRYKARRRRRRASDVEKVAI